MTDSRRLSIAVDIGMLQPEGAGISRYVSQVLPRVMRLSLDANQTLNWHLYGRQPTQVAGLELPDFCGHWDHLPLHVGRILSLAGSSTFWAQRDRPDIFWGPAQRLPLGIPRETSCVVTVHDLAAWKFPRSMRWTTRILDRSLMGPTIRRSNRVIAVSQATADDLAELLPACRGKLQIVREGISLPGFMAHAIPEPTRPNPGFFLFVGTLEPRKNLARLMEAYAHAVHSVPDLPELVVAGAVGWGHLDLDARVRQNRISDRVRFLGRVSDSELSQLYNDACCLVMPSLYEGFGLPLAEALHYGKPIITSNCSSMPEVAGDAGLLVDPNSVESIANALRRIAGDPGLRVVLAANARARAKGFSWDLAARETLSVLIDASRRRGLVAPVH